MGPTTPSLCLPLSAHRRYTAARASLLFAALETWRSAACFCELGDIFCSLKERVLMLAQDAHQLTRELHDPLLSHSQPHH